MDKCGILYTRNEFKDHDGCIKPDAHNDFHVCRLPNGTILLDYTEIKEI